MRLAQKILRLDESSSLDQAERLSGRALLVGHFQGGRGDTDHKGAETTVLGDSQSQILHLYEGNLGVDGTCEEGTDMVPLLSHVRLGNEEGQGCGRTRY